mmetsp:Transcript_14426/g.16247  ORF Transcript_14426/g.16247 Transcript_14426/m.16247 type:complete len:89 (-) Transcript_14426:299-565(-)
MEATSYSKRERERRTILVHEGISSLQYHNHRYTTINMIAFVLSLSSNGGNIEYTTALIIVLHVWSKRREARGRDREKQTIQVTDVRAC